MKTILIAIPHNKYISPETMKCIYDLTLPHGYEKYVEFFYGYKPSQVLNLIGNWGKQCEGVLFLTQNSVFTSDRVKQMLESGGDIVTSSDCRSLDVTFVSGRVFAELEYPHFDGDLYSDYFFNKATEQFEVVSLDTGSYVLEDEKVNEVLYNVFLRDLLPRPFINYLQEMVVEPPVIYDIGSAVLHWTRHARKRWTHSKVYLFDATPEVEPLYKALGECDYHIGVLTDVDGKEVSFYNDPTNIGGNSYYKENTVHYGEQHKTVVRGRTLDSVVAEKNMPLPNMMKLDVQGAEIDVLRGATVCLSACDDVILEAQHVDYNRGAPKVGEVIDYMADIDFYLVSEITKNSIDGDYHFRRG